MVIASLFLKKEEIIADRQTEGTMDTEGYIEDFT